MENKGKRMAGKTEKPKKEKKERTNNETTKTKKKMGKGKKIAIIIISILLLFSVIFGVLVYIASTTLGKVGFEKLDESQLGLNNDLSTYCEAIKKPLIEEYLMKLESA